MVPLPEGQLRITTSIPCTIKLHQIDRDLSPALLALCAGDPMITSGFPAQRASNTESVSMSSHYTQEVNGP